MVGICEISYLNGELEAHLFFSYGNTTIPAEARQLQPGEIESFVTQEGIVARNLVEEQKLVDALFQDFYYNSDTGRLHGEDREKR